MVCGLQLLLVGQRTMSLRNPHLSGVTAVPTFTLPPAHPSEQLLRRPMKSPTRSVVGSRLCDLIQTHTAHVTCNDRDVNGSLY